MLVSSRYKGSEEAAAACCATHDEIACCSCQTGQSVVYGVQKWLQEGKARTAKTSDMTSLLHCMLPLPATALSALAGCLQCGGRSRLRQIGTGDGSAFNVNGKAEGTMTDRSRLSHALTPLGHAIQRKLIRIITDARNPGAWSTSP